jgi:hypothetical protein
MEMTSASFITKEVRTLFVTKYMKYPLTGAALLSSAMTICHVWNTNLSGQYMKILEQF